MFYPYASLRGDSTYLRSQAEAVAAELLKGEVALEPKSARNTQGSRTQLVYNFPSICERRAS
jgi:hypothetical protein